MFFWPFIVVILPLILIEEAHRALQKLRLKHDKVKKARVESDIDLAAIEAELSEFLNKKELINE